MTFAHNLRTLALLSASVFASASFATTVSQEVWVGPEPVVTGPALSRAEVQADLLLWKQAGLDAYTHGEGSAFDLPNYNTKLAQYQQQRNSPAFTALVQRLEAAAQ